MNANNEVIDGGEVLPRFNGVYGTLHLNRDRNAVTIGGSTAQDDHRSPERDVHPKRTVRITSLQGRESVDTDILKALLEILGLLRAHLNPCPADHDSSHPGSVGTPIGDTPEGGGTV